MDEAVTNLRRALEFQPDKLPEIYYTLGVILLQQAKLDESANAFQKATEIKPDYGEAIYTLGSVRQQQGKLDEAITLFRAALKFFARRAGNSQHARRDSTRKRRY